MSGRRWDTRVVLAFRQHLPLVGLLVVWLAFLLGCVVLVSKHETPSARSLKPAAHRLPTPVRSPNGTVWSAEVASAEADTLPRPLVVTAVTPPIQAPLPDSPPLAVQQTSVHHVAGQESAVPASELLHRAIGRSEHTLPGLTGAGLLATLPTTADLPQSTPVPVPSVAVTQPNTAQVWLTGYSLVGTTTTGIPSGPGICAVDPSFIPLGTRITIDRLGSCLAADTGPAVVGAHLDVWVPTSDQAYALTGWYTVHW